MSTGFARRRPEPRIDPSSDQPHFNRNGVTRALLIVSLLALLGAPSPSRGQPTNLAVFEDLGVRCLAPAADTVSGVALDAPEQMPYVRAAISRHWQEEGRDLYLADSARVSPPAGSSILSYRIEEARVEYRRARGRQLQRTVVLALRYTLVSPDRRVLRDDRCRESYQDLVPARLVGLLESAAFAETRGAVPEGNWFRRYVEPAVLVAATAVGVYLFFSLRSGRADDAI
jgi:hypothetical protein